MTSPEITVRDMISSIIARDNPDLGMVTEKANIKTESRVLACVNKVAGSTTRLSTVANKLAVIPLIGSKIAGEQLLQPWLHSRNRFEVIQFPTLDSLTISAASASDQGIAS